EPADAAGEDRFPVEIARPEQGSSFVGAVVEHDWSADAVPTIAVNGGHVGTVDAIVLEALVEGPDAHGADAFRDEVADRIVDHGGGDAGLQFESVGQIRGAVEFAAADVDLTATGLAERDDAGVEAMNEGAEREEIETVLFGRRNF